MSKILIIEKCTQCPHISIDWNGTYYKCNLTEEQLGWFDDIDEKKIQNKIPHNCPLKDYKEK